MAILANITFLGPFLLVLLDAIIARPTDWRRLSLGGTCAGLSALAAVLAPRGGDWLLLSMTAVLAIFYCRWLQGLARFTVVFASTSIICMLASRLSPDGGTTLNSLLEMLFLPINVALWVVPPLAVWLLWRMLPVAFDRLRGGNWATTGVPLIVRYRLLAAATLCLSALCIALYLQWSAQGDVLRRCAGNALLDMNSQLRRLENSLANHDRYYPADWRQDALTSLWQYRTAAGTLATLVDRDGTVGAGPLNFLARTFPEGVADALERADPASAEALNVIRTMQEALRLTADSDCLRPTTYQQVVNEVLANLQGTSIQSLFDSIRSR